MRCVIVPLNQYDDMMMMIFDRLESSCV